MDCSPPGGFKPGWQIKSYQAPPSMGFSRQEYWSGLPFLSPGDLPDPGIEPRSPAFQADALTSEPPGKPYTLLNAVGFSLDLKLFAYAAWRTLSFGLLLLLSHFSRVRLCVTPETAAHQAPLSLGFSRQEHWSGLPFPSPMRESEKWKWSRSVVSDPQRPHGLQPTRLLCPGRSTGVGCHCLLRSFGQFCINVFCEAVLENRMLLDSGIRCV